MYCKDGPNTGYRIRPGPSKIKSRLNPNLTPESAWKRSRGRKKTKRRKLIFIDKYCCVFKTPWSPGLTCVWATSASRGSWWCSPPFCHACAPDVRHFYTNPVLQWIKKRKTIVSWSDTVTRQPSLQLHRQSLMVIMHWFHWMFICHIIMFNPFDNSFLKE